MKSTSDLIREYKSEITRLQLLNDKENNIQARAINCSNPGLINYIVNYYSYKDSKHKICFSRMGNNYHIFNREAKDYRSENNCSYKDFSSAIKDLKHRIDSL